MSFQFTHPVWLLALIPALGWVVAVGWKTDVSLGQVRRWLTFVVRSVLTLAIVLALAGLQHRKPLDAMNVFFLLDRSDSIPSVQQETALRYVNDAVKRKETRDNAGVLVFASDAALENTESHAMHAALGFQESERVVFFRKALR